MSSTKSRPNKTRDIQEPQRRNGKLRVAAILKAAAAVIAEKGYEAATMAEIAARSDTKIGSLYRFFPSKDALADAMMIRYVNNIDAQFDAIKQKAKTLTVSALAGALLAIIPQLHKDAAASLRLMEASKGWSAKREALRASALSHIAQLLVLYAPHVKPAAARDMAFVLLHNMKAASAFSNLNDPKIRAGAARELRHMTELYLRSTLRKTT